MKYVAIDIETSGLDSERNQILSIGAIIEDTKYPSPFDDIPKFNAIVLQREVTGSPRALMMNKDILNIMSAYLDADMDEKIKIALTSGYAFMEEDKVAQNFFDFLWANGFDYKFGRFGREARILHTLNYHGDTPLFNGNIKPILINVAGKNFGTFDKLFLQKLPWWKKLIQPAQRIIDPAVLYCDWKEDQELPSLTVCKARAETQGGVRHEAIFDAWDVILLLRKFYLT
jgi:oligoribonuclease